MMIDGLGWPLAILLGMALAGGFLTVAKATIDDIWRGRR